ncbi:hypothetical protein K474DRAFT_529825 [Panus rudis PR-1116 ss-1]|nr:hypothetical protein K474DRAFT_529825 [Panus rudis PR-1116 ss-1]
MTPGRKRHVCRTCHQPMAGHKRPRGAFVCPTPNPGAAHLNSPSPTSSYSDYVDLKRSESPGEEQAIRYHSDTPESYEDLTDGVSEQALPSPPQTPGPHNRLHRHNAVARFPRHWVNPNYVETHAEEPIPSTSRFDPYRRSPSWVPTEPASDRSNSQSRNVKAETKTVIVQHNGTTSVSSCASGSSATSTIPNSTLFRVVAVPQEDIAKAKRVAEKKGYHAGIVHLPKKFPIASRESASSTSLVRESSYALAIGCDESAVAAVVAVHEQAEQGWFESGQRNEKVGAIPVPPTAPYIVIPFWYLIFYAVLVAIMVIGLYLCLESLI